MNFNVAQIQVRSGIIFELGYVPSRAEIIAAELDRIHRRWREQPLYFWQIQHPEYGRVGIPLEEAFDLRTFHAPIQIAGTGVELYKGRSIIKWWKRKRDFALLYPKPEVQVITTVKPHDVTSTSRMIVGLEKLLG